MSDKDKLPPLNFAALADALLPRAADLVAAWLPGGVQRGHEYVCGSLAGGKGTSCSVNLNTGEWADFSGDEKGRDLVSLYAKIHGLSNARACVELARAEGLESVAGVVKAADGSAPPVRAPRPAPPPKPAPEREGWKAIMPVPGYAPKVNFMHQHRTEADIMHVSEYWRDADLLGYVVRFRTSDGGKDDIARTWCESQTKGGARWHWKQWEEPRPLYLPGRTLRDGCTVVLVEGERKGDVLQQLLEAGAPGVYDVVGWPGGCKAWAKADWAWLAGRTVLLWPDCDSKREQPTAAERKAVEAQVRGQLPHEAQADDVRNAPEYLQAMQALKESKPFLAYHEQPGMKAQRAIGAVLRDTHGCTVSLLPIAQPGVLPDGWDAKDAIESDGWTFERVQAFFGTAVVLLETPEPAADQAKAQGGKKIDPPVGTESADSPEAEGWEYDLIACGGRKVPRWVSWYYDPEKERWNVSRKTVIAALQKDHALQGVVAFNDLTNTPQCRKAGPWAHSRAGDIRGADALLLGQYLSDTYGLPAISKAALEEGIQTVAYMERYHPIREWLQGLKWDNKPRLDKWLMYVLGEGPGSINARLAEYLALVGRYWVLGMVNRVMEPGCKFDYCPVLEGVGGLRKSTLVMTLAGKEYFSDTKFEVGRGKEGQEQMQGLWLYEIAEMAGMSKAEVGDIKAFISSAVDRYRVAYGSTVEKFPRQCVLVGTTNEDTYLRDRTGNRRFWPVPVRHQIKTEWVAKWREQLFAEAFAQYLAGARYTPTGDEEKRLFAPMQDSRLVETAVESELLAVLTRAPAVAGPGSVVHRDSEFVTVANLVWALGLDAAKSSAALENQIRGWMKQQGWEKAKRQINGVRANGYARPQVWPPEGGVVGLDQLPMEVAQEGGPGADPAPSAAAAQSPALSAAEAFLRDMDPGACDPF